MDVFYQVPKHWTWLEFCVMCDNVEGRRAWYVVYILYGPNLTYVVPTQLHFYVKEDISVSFVRLYDVGHFNDHSWFGIKKKVLL